MKCPKCQYLAFDEEDRCRNCGYEFALVVDDSVLDLPIRTGDEPLGPFADFALGEPRAADDGERQPVSSSRVARMTPPEMPVQPSPPELPLFHGRHAGDAPLVSLPASPRAPVSVRKSTVARATARRQPEDEPTLDLEGDASTDGDASVEVDAFNASRPKASPPVERGAAHAAVAPMGARLVGGAVDLLLMGGIDLAVLDLTLRLSELTYANIALIPWAPFAAFLALLNGGYLTAFTVAGGQTIGKMIAGTRVATSDEYAATDRVTLPQSALRAVGYLISLLPAGLGFVPALVGPDHRAFHDRLAHTRVVKA